MKIFLILLFWMFPQISGQSHHCWGFFAHKEINKIAIFTLPPEMIVFYKKHLDFITQNAVNPDKRRYAIKEEACRHFIDLDRYPDHQVLPKYWNDAAALYGADSLMKHGVVPWHIQKMKYELTNAFKQKSPDKILRLSADIGHYIGDANVPLHTTKNYNGQLTGQHGIHGFWESRLPETFHETYDFFVGKAMYQPDTQLSAWEAVLKAHAAKDSVLLFEKELSQKIPEDLKYGFEERGGLTMKVYSKEYSEQYHKMLQGQVERQMRNAIIMTGSYWYTCWVDAGQPDLNTFLSFEQEENEKQEIEKEKNNKVNADHCEAH